MTLFLFFDEQDHMIAVRYSEKEADRFQKHTRQQEPDKSFLRLEVDGAALTRSETLKPLNTGAA